jgi:beta-phosphoglucomutase-like phosphatase (HAD superfamily)
MAKLGLNSQNSIAIEDSNSGVRSALAANLHVLCPPSHQIIVSDDKLKLIDTLEGITLKDLEFWDWK